jgi:hypothetical protein
MQFLSRFNYKTLHIPGERNQVADALSRYHEFDLLTDHCDEINFLDMDRKLDPEGDILPIERVVQIRTNALRHSQRLRKTESWKPMR